MVYEYLGAASGATLGYMYDNIDGAIEGAKYGWKAGKALNKKYGTHHSLPFPR